MLMNVTTACSGQQRGVTLIELLVGLTIGLVILAGAGSVYVNTVKSSSNNIALARLNQELRASISLMMRDIRRAGYWAAAPGVDDLTNNPFQQSTDDIATGEYTSEATDSCITYTYDFDRDKTVDATERFGFRLNSGAIEMRKDDTPFSCTGGTWESVTTDSVEITALQFTMPTTTSGMSITNPGNACATSEFCLDVRSVDITLTGRLADNTAVQQTLSESVRLRNDRFYVAP